MVRLEYIDTRVLLLSFFSKHTKTNTIPKKKYNMSNVGSSTSHRRAAGETTEWEDILRKKGIKGPSEYELELQAAAADEAVRLAEEASSRIDPLASKSIKALDELEEEGGEYEDSRALDSYRLKRLAEIKAKAARNKFGEMTSLGRVDFVREVSEASKDSWVVVFLHQNHVQDSQLLARVLPAVAAKHAAVKFVAMTADACIEGYPDRNVPTLLLYHDGSLQSQIVGLGEFGGIRVTKDMVEWVLSRRGVCESDIEDDPRDPRSIKGKNNSRRNKDEDDDDDDDED